MERKLTTIFASDVVGFSKMMGEDEVNTLKVLNERRAVIDQSIDDLSLIHISEPTRRRGLT